MRNFLSDMLSNRTNGTRFEAEFSRMLAQHGFWCHLMTQSKAGQPADIIAVRGDYHTLIDCKVISDKRGFPFSRAEDNQRSAMGRFEKRGKFPCWFALRLPDGRIRMLCYTEICLLEDAGTASLTGKTLEQYTISFEEWLEFVIRG